ncbi:MAG TPA: PKD domain-containing protein, partial [Thermoanaerobaculia bacterium]|nr:PKD domain-containing protein [Thermoanaerobaculia bacterium]
LVFRIVSQPRHGTVGLSGGAATYFPEANFAGTDAFTFAAWDGKIDSNLAAGSVAVQAPVCTINCSATVPASASAGSAVAFQASASLSTGCTSAPSYDWDFGDGSAHGSTANQTHVYGAAGTYTWKLVVSANGASCARSGTITVTNPCSIACAASVPATARVGKSVPFKSTATASGCSGTPAFNWDFGDGSPHATVQNPKHAYRARGTYTWRLTVTISGATCSRSGSITVN